MSTSTGVHEVTSPEVVEEMLKQAAFEVTRRRHNEDVAMAKERIRLWYVLHMARGVVNMDKAIETIGVVKSSVARDVNGKDAHLIDHVARARELGVTEDEIASLIQALPSKVDVRVDALEPQAVRDAKAKRSRSTSKAKAKGGRK